jgi:hypothetical protein
VDLKSLKSNRKTTSFSFTHINIAHLPKNSICEVFFYQITRPTFILNTILVATKSLKNEITKSFLLLRKKLSLGLLILNKIL